ncbi:MAG: hypothetical protein WC325_04525 [Candidatus Bathyarchaeia archaeon]|jgi:hypothetical protein
MSVKIITDKLRAVLNYLNITKKIVLLMVIVAVVSIVGTSMVSVALNRTTNFYLPSLAVIKTIEVEAYSDAGGHNIMEQIEWGELEPGSSVTNSFYIKSVSNFEIILTLKLTDWNPPEIADYITISWDYNGTRMSPSEIIPITMTATASSSNGFIDYLVENGVKQFSVEVHFIGVE